MPKTKIRSHDRKGTKGVKQHSRKTPESKTVPHTRENRIPVEKLLKDLDLELNNFTFFDSKTSQHRTLTDFKDIPDNIRNKKWNFEVEIDRLPVEGSNEYGFIAIKGHRVTGKKRQAKRTGINLTKMRLQPTGYETVETYQTITLDTRIIDPIYDDEKDKKNKIKSQVKKTLKSNFSNINSLTYRWED